MTCVISGAITGSVFERFVDRILNRSFVSFNLELFIIIINICRYRLSFSVLSALQCFKKVWIKNKNPKIIYIYIYIVTKIQNKKPKIVHKLA